MSFRSRLTLAAAGAVAAAIVILSVVTYVVVRAEQRAEVDRSLKRIAAVAQIAEPPAQLIHIKRPPEGFAIRGNRTFRLPEPRLGGAAGYLQVVQPSGRTERPPGAPTMLPVTVSTREVAAHHKGPFFTDAHIGGTHVRILTVPGRRAGVAFQLARPLTEVDRVMRRIAWVLVIVSVAGVLGAAGAGLIVARSALRPVRRLTEAAEHVAATQDLDAHIPDEGRDELSRLGRAFNRMLDALSSSRRAQRQLVADASHELRTPLTSLRANLELLASGHEVPDADRRQLLGDLVSQAKELSVLVGDLVDLARDGDRPFEREPVRLDELVRVATERVRRRSPETPFVLADLQPTEVLGDRATLDRAVVNLLDNAIKFSPAGAPVEVTVHAGRVAVRDHGPGIADEDIPLVFDRFYRAASARSLPGSGLGLAIVRQVAQAHGGSAFAQHAAGGGTRLVINLPVNGLPGAPPGTDARRPQGGLGLRPPAPRH